jgi:esterase/lipase superfamily enzyme
MRAYRYSLPALFCAVLVSAECISSSATSAATSIHIPFLTNRAVTTQPDGSTRYSTDTAALSAGDCVVDLTMEEELRARNGAIAPKPLDAVTNAFAETSDRGIVLYIHGYNIGLARACRDAARLAQVTGFTNRLLLFSWPASRAVLTYRKDEARLAASTPIIIAAINELAGRYGRERLSIVAHSMGTRVMLALADNAVTSNTEASGQFANLVLVAPDIDRERFLLSANALKKLAKNLSILVSENDKLLLLSQMVNAGERLGQADDLSLNDIQIIDVSEFENLGFSGHIYHLENRKVGDLLRRILEPSADR